MTDKTFEGVDISTGTDKSIKVTGHIDNKEIKHIDKIEEIIPFEEQFPSLKGKVIGIYPTMLEFPDDGRRGCDLKSTSEYLCKTIKEDNSSRAYRIDFLFEQDIKEHCLDKQKVREAIRKATVRGVIYGREDNQNCIELDEDILKEGLGL